MPKKIISFGFRHGDIPKSNDSNMVIDVRKWFGRNPYHDKKLRYLRGTDEAVQEDILKTPFFSTKYETLLGVVSSFGQSVTVYLGCTGGHHRSVYLAERIGKELNITVEHRDYNKK